MNNEERDKMLAETLEKTTQTHTAVMVMAEKVGNHDDTLYGNGQPGLVKDVVVLKERQKQCPGRKAGSVENKRLGVAYIMMIIGVIAVILSIINFWHG
jgi:hypothetical protein